MNDEKRHISERYEAELQHLAAEITSMGRLAVRQLQSGVRALLQGDRALANIVDAGDDGLDAQELQVAQRVLRLLALRQPTAVDLRHVLAALRVASDIERIGDYGVNIARRSLAIDRPVPPALAEGIAALSELANGQVRDVVDAWEQRDNQLARRARQRDDNLDAAYVDLFRALLEHMEQDPADIKICSHLLFVAKNLERAGDHANNIAENIHFMIGQE